MKSQHTHVEALADCSGTGVRFPPPPLVFCSVPPPRNAGFLSLCSFSPLNDLELTGHSVSCLIIGDELLNDKVQDQNSPVAIRELNKHGLDLQSLHMIPDDKSIIIHHVRRESERNDYLITSGGLGPTHDDLTMEAIADAFEVPLTTNQTYRDTLEKTYGPDPDPSVYRMAEMPEHVEFHWGSDLDIPAARFRNVFILPGEPRLFRTKLDAIMEDIQTSRTTCEQRLYLNVRETEIADFLRDLQERFPNVNIGSYPSPWNDEYTEQVIIEGSAEFDVERATEEIVREVGSPSVVRREDHT